MKHKLFLFLLLATQFASAQSPLVNKVRAYTKQNQHNIISEFKDFLAIPNVARDRVNMQKNAAFIMEMMQKRGIQNVQLLDAQTQYVPPAVYGEVIVPGAKQTLIFYAHYDGQPVNPAQWAKGLAPYQPKLFTAAIDKNGTGDSISC
jgi:acetylornithine deacetylase/succinyl-diaminopimelate desuccinylase-like protein